MASPQPPKTIFVPYDVLESAEVVVTQTPSTLLPGHRVLVAGANIVFDSTIPNELTINGTGGGGGVPAHAPTHEPGGSDPLTVDAVPATGSLRTLGPGANQAAPGNDARFSDARPPTAHHITHEPGGSDPLVVDAVPATGSLRTLGPGANQAAPGNDARLTNARTPTAHNTTHQTGGSDVVDVKLLGGYPGGTSFFLRADGTFALPPSPSLSGLVPYVGATTDVNLGAFGLYARVVNARTNVYTNGPTPGLKDGGALFLTEATSAFGLIGGTSINGNVWLQVQRVDNFNTDTYQMHLQPRGGNVGIGNTGPIRWLHVGPATTLLNPYQGAVVVGPAGDVAMVTAKSTVQGCEMVMLAHVGDGIFGTWSNHPLSFRVGSIHRAGINTNGVFSLANGMAVGGFMTTPLFTGNVDNWNPTSIESVFQIQMQASTPMTLFGVKAQEDGRIIVLTNGGSFPITIAHNSSSLTADRILTMPGGVILNTFECITIRCLGGPGGSGWFMIGLGKA